MHNYVVMCPNSPSEVGWDSVKHALPDKWAEQDLNRTSSPQAPEKHKLLWRNQGYPHPNLIQMNYMESLVPFMNFLELENGKKALRKLEEGFFFVVLFLRFLGHNW